MSEGVRNCKKFGNHCRRGNDSRCRFTFICVCVCVCVSALHLYVLSRSDAFLLHSAECLQSGAERTKEGSDFLLTERMKERKKGTTTNGR